MRKTERNRETGVSKRQENGGGTDLYCTAGTSPPDNGVHHSSLRLGGVRIGSVRFVQTSDLQNRLRRMALLLLGTKADGKGSSKRQILVRRARL